jgi:hypothetical protein
MVSGAQAITSIAVDNRTITLTNNLPATSTAMAGPAFGKAFVLSEDDSWFPCEVVRLVPSAKQVILAEALPRDITTRAVSILWADHYVQLSNANVTATAQRNILWRVTYLPKLAGAAVAGTDTSAYDEGFIHVVRRPFETGLNSNALKTIFSGVAQLVPNRQQGWEPQIETALISLILMVRAELREQSLYEDDIDGRPLLLAHAYLTAAIIMELQDSTKAEALKAQANEYFETAMRGLWVDDNEDGIVDSAEVATHITGPRTADVGGSFRTSTRTPSFSIGQSH